MRINNFGTAQIPFCDGELLFISDMLSFRLSEPYLHQFTRKLYEVKQTYMEL